MGNATNILCPRCKEQEESQHYFNLLQASQNYSETSKLSQNFTHTYLRDTSSELDLEETFVKAWRYLLNNNGILNIKVQVICID